MEIDNDQIIKEEVEKEGGQAVLTRLEQEKTEKARENLQKKNKDKKNFNEKIKGALLYAGIWGASISAIAYLIITLVIVKGFTTKIELQQQILFAVLGAVTGLMITFFLRSQGITLAKKEPVSIEVMAKYYEIRNKQKTAKQLHTITTFMIWATIRDVIVKGASVATSTWFILFVFLEGNGNWGLMGLAGANLLMFTGFGLMALSGAYDKYVDEHIPVIKALTDKLEELAKEKEKKDD